jgi:hypothetical protein
VHETLRGLPRASSALVRAATLNLPSCSVDITHPTTRREKRSITGARYSHPALVRTYFTSVIHLRLGARAVKFQSSLFGETRSDGHEPGVARNDFFLRAIRSFSRMSLAIRDRPTRMPSSCRSIRMRGLP